MRDVVYPPVITIAIGLFRGLGLRFTVEGAENIPRDGGAVLASNHIGYLDFTFVGYAARPQGRLVRFMAKESVFRNPVSGPLMRGMHHIPVDRAAGASALASAVRALRAGELVGVFPEATISRSWMVKDLKTGAARVAELAGVPIIPMAIWGSQRVYTKGRRRDLGRGKAITMAVGEPFDVASYPDTAAASAELGRRMSRLLDGLQQSYPQSPGAGEDPWWVPAHRGGTAPTPEQARELDAAERRRR